MLTQWVINDVREPERYALYAHGYLDSATAFCEHMVLHEEWQTWPNASVALMIAAHSVELFLKGAILARAPALQVESYRLDALTRIYGELYAEPSCLFDVPFRMASPNAIETETRALKVPKPIPAILFRRARKTRPGEWQTALAFKAHEFLEVLLSIRTSYERIGKSTTPQLRR